MSEKREGWRKKREEIGKGATEEKFCRARETKEEERRGWQERAIWAIERDQSPDRERERSRERKREKWRHRARAREREGGREILSFL